MGGSASDLFDTFRTFEALPDATVVHPGHDYVGQAVSTIGEEKAENPLLRERDRAAFVARLSVKTPPPANMAAIIRHNLGEADAATIAPAGAPRLSSSRSPTPFLLDVRSPLEFEGEHIDRGAADSPRPARHPPGRGPRERGRRRRVPDRCAGDRSRPRRSGAPGAGRACSRAG